MRMSSGGIGSPDRPELARAQGPRDVDAFDLRTKQRMELGDLEWSGVAHDDLRTQSTIAW
jgi:hypothetical protein